MRYDLAADGTASTRRNSLMYSLPLRLSKFTYNASGLTASNTGATPIQVLQLESQPAAPSRPDLQLGDRRNPGKGSSSCLPIYASWV